MIRSRSAAFPRRGQGCTNLRRLVPRVFIFCTESSNILSKINAVIFSLHTIICISLHAPSRKRQITMKFRGYYSNVARTHSRSTANCQKFVEMQSQHIVSLEPVSVARTCWQVCMACRSDGWQSSGTVLKACQFIC